MIGRGRETFVVLSYCVLGVNVRFLEWREDCVGWNGVSDLANTSYLGLGPARESSTDTWHDAGWLLGLALQLGESHPQTPGMTLAGYWAWPSS